MGCLHCRSSGQGSMTDARPVEGQVRRGGGRVARHPGSDLVGPVRSPRVAGRQWAVWEGALGAARTEAMRPCDMISRPCASADHSEKTERYAARIREEARDAGVLRGYRGALSRRTQLAPIRKAGAIHGEEVRGPAAWGRWHGHRRTAGGWRSSKGLPPPVPPGSLITASETGGP